MATPIYAPHLFPENAEAKYNEFMMRIATCVYARNGETAWLYGTDNLVGYLNELCDYGP